MRVCTVTNLKQPDFAPGLASAMVLILQAPELAEVLNKLAMSVFAK
jgi:hypothetical protein